MNKKMSLRRTLVFAAIAVMLLATTAFAVGKIYGISSHSSRNDAFTQLPSVGEMADIINATPKRIAQFDNGYQFEEGVVVHQNGRDEAGNVITQSKALSLSYMNGDQRVALILEQPQLGQSLSDVGAQSTYGGVTLHSFDYINKIINADYVKTEQDLLDEVAGRVSFSYMGGDTVETTAVQMVLWLDGEVQYTLLTFDSPLSGDQLLAMARQVIDQA